MRAGALCRDRLGDRAAGSLRSPNSIAPPPLGGAGLDAGRQAAGIDARRAQRAALDRALAARRVRLLVVDRLVHERARLVGAGHHAVAAADADVPVDQHDAVGPLERGAGRADVDAGRAWRNAGTSPAPRALAPVAGSRTLTLRIHCGSVARWPVSPSRSRRGRRRRRRRSSAGQALSVDQAGPSAPSARRPRRRARRGLRAAQRIERDAGREQHRQQPAGAAQQRAPVGRAVWCGCRAHRSSLALPRWCPEIGRQILCVRRRAVAAGCRLGRRGPRGVAFEAVDRHRRIVVAARGRNGRGRHSSPAGRRRPARRGRRCSRQG